MIVARFKSQCRPDRADEVATAIAAVEAPSRGAVGVALRRSPQPRDPNVLFAALLRRRLRDREAARPSLSAEFRSSGREAAMLGVVAYERRQGW